MKGLKDCVCDGFKYIEKRERSKQKFFIGEIFCGKISFGYPEILIMFPSKCKKSVKMYRT